MDFIRGPGYVLDFNDRSFAAFFASELKVDINDARYADQGGSKGKRLRRFLQLCDDHLAVQTLTALWECRVDHLARSGAKDPVFDAEGRYRKLIALLSGAAPRRAPAPVVSASSSHLEILERTKAELLQLALLAPQARGYAFEKFLRSLFNAYGLAAHEPFRLLGEQIDGSFQLASEIYLLEAKWQAEPAGVAELHTFHGKIEQKAAWTRGLFISNSGFSEDGRVAFGRGRRVICMDGLDLYEMLERQIPLPQLLERKVRRAAETGAPFVRVRDLY